MDYWRDRLSKLERSIHVDDRELLRGASLIERSFGFAVLRSLTILARPR